MLKQTVTSAVTGKFKSNTYTWLFIQRRNGLEEANINKNRNNFLSWGKQLCVNYLPCTIKHIFFLSTLM